jgi:hypothetical protein
VVAGEPEPPPAPESMPPPSRPGVVGLPLSKL